jgi:hypothetical protein
LAKKRRKLSRESFLRMIFKDWKLGCDEEEMGEELVNRKLTWILFSLDPEDQLRLGFSS